MILKIIDKIGHYFSASGFFLRKAEQIVKLINEKEQFFVNKTDLQIKEHTQTIRQKIFDGIDIFDHELIADCFAMTREASKRTLGMRHFDVQLVGGLALHFGMVAQMLTGEGKTLTATLPAVLNALTGNAVHIITVNDYLASRDQAWMSVVYDFLGLTSDTILSSKNPIQRKKAYTANIVYGTNNEFGFDYLRDNMEISLKDMVQNGLHFAVIDEADSVLIDEARTPLIISGPSQDTAHNYLLANEIIKALDTSFIEVNEQDHAVNITDQGYEQIEKFLTEKGFFAKPIAEGVLLHPEIAASNGEKGEGLNGEMGVSSIEDEENNLRGLFAIENLSLLHHIGASARAHYLFKKNKDYIVRDGKILIVDEFTGRVMEGRRYSDGLHQALEAKESVKIHGENQTIASTTFQNYFRLYKRISGMTGTAYTEKAEFKQIYNLDICCVPTNMPVQRADLDDEIYATAAEKYQAILKEIKLAHEKKQPVLVGTVSIEKSEIIAEMLKSENIKHYVLNAKYHEQEAQIIAEAGLPGAVTIATNMAGRGTDIKLGGNEDMMLRNVTDNTKRSNIIEQIQQDKKTVLDAGGLYVIGTERHESRRIDDQLRGRSGRQGDPGRSKFFLSLEDDLMRIFGTNKAAGLLKTLGLKQGEAIVHPLISRAISRAQKKVETRNFEIRKNILQYDNILNTHRSIIFKYRNTVLRANTKEKITDLLAQVYKKANEKIVKNHIPGHNLNNFLDQSMFSFVQQDLIDLYQKIDLSEIEKYLEQQTIHASEMLNIINEKVEKIFAAGFEINLNKEEGNGQGSKAEYSNSLGGDVGNGDVKTGASSSSISVEEEDDYAIEKRTWLATIDEFWRQHLLSMDYLRQTSGAKSFAQKDPLVEYTKEAYELFKDLMEKIEYNFLQKLVNLRDFIEKYEFEQTKAQSIDSEKVGSKNGHDKNSNFKITYRM